MRTQSHLSLGDVPDDLPDCDCVGDDEGLPEGGLCCPDDPLDLVLQFLPAPAPHDVSLAALGIGGSPSPRRQDQPPPPFACGQENGFGGAGVLGAGKSATGSGGGGFLERDSQLGWSSHVPEDIDIDIDIDMFLVDDAPDGGGGRGGEATVCNPSRDTGAMPAGGVHTCGAFGGVLSNDAPPLAALPMFADALRPYACRAFDGVVPNDAPPLPALMPASGGLHAFGAASNDAPPLAAPMSAGGVHAHGAFMGGIFSNNTPAPPLRVHAPLPARPSPASSGCLSSTTSESQSPSPVRQPLAWVVRRKRRRSPFMWRKRPWSLDFPLHAVPETAPEYPGDNNNGNPVDNRNGNGDAKNSCNNGGIRRRRPVPRQRNRQTQRVCSHCHSPDTPQWRAGPDGPGTLCNACGIRYAANKLLPEYRPSTAPSFRSGQHSNRHRKVVKLRKQKEEETLRAMADPVPAPPKDDEFMGVCTYISTGL